MKFNKTSATDAYKFVHWYQRPLGLTKLYSYGEPRVGGQHDKVCFYLLQYIIKEFFMGTVSDADIEKGYKRSLQVFGNCKYFNLEVWRKVRDLGYLPLRIKAVKEGTVLPVGNVCFTVEATEDWFAPMVSHVEDWLMWCWYGTGVATRVYNIKKGILPAHETSCDNPFLNYSVNDFGLRGAQGYEAACIGGSAHLIFFDGSDNVPAMDFIEEYYVNDNIGGSVWATEHSVATSWGPNQGEFDYVNAQLDRAGDDATISIVIDSYDADNFIKNVIGSSEIKKKIIARKGRTVLRPDSGDPLTNICKYSEMLGNIFGYHLNGKDYKIINHNVGIIQGDGMNEHSIPFNYNEYIKTGWSAENVVTGSGGGLLVEGLTRDTDRWAIKASYAEINGQSINVCKAPKTDPTKNSKFGKLKLHKSGKSFSTIESGKDIAGNFDSYYDELELVFENGVLYRDQTFEEIRQIANSYL